jgi:hypothetical protein
MNKCRWVVVGLLLVTLTSCSVFLTPPKGRWNPLDPTKDAGETLAVTADGYIDGGGMNFFIEPIIFAGDTYRGLLRFPFSSVGADLVHAELELYLDSGASYSIETAVRAVLQDWVPGSVSWYQVSMPTGFYSTSSSPWIQVFQPGLYHFDVTSLFSAFGASAIKGLLVETRGSAGYSLKFRSSEWGGTTPPKLLLWYPKW